MWKSRNDRRRHDLLFAEIRHAILGDPVVAVDYEEKERLGFLLFARGQGG